jgi:hypothetical protein
VQVFSLCFERIRQGVQVFQFIDEFDYSSNWILNWKPTESNKQGTSFFKRESIFLKWKSLKKVFLYALNYSTAWSILPAETSFVDCLWIRWHKFSLIADWWSDWGSGQKGFQHRSTGVLHQQLTVSERLLCPVTKSWPYRHIWETEGRSKWHSFINSFVSAALCTMPLDNSEGPKVATRGVEWKHQISFQKSLAAVPKSIPKAHPRRWVNHKPMEG